jgi:hypothetical protein
MLITFNTILPGCKKTSAIRGSYLLPVPDFASHSPFGGARGASWFLRYAPDRGFE